MNRILFLPALLLLFSCADALDPKVLKAADSISKTDCIMLDFVFLDPDYVSLMKVSATEDLVRLTKHKNPYVRYYAFIGLLERHYPDIRKICSAHNQDNQSVRTSNGACIQGPASLNALMKSALSPESFYIYIFRKNKYHINPKNHE